MWTERDETWLGRVEAPWWESRDMKKVPVREGALGQRESFSFPPSLHNPCITARSKPKMASICQDCVLAGRNRKCHLHSERNKTRLGANARRELQSGQRGPLT